MIRWGMGTGFGGRKDAAQSCWSSAELGLRLGDWIRRRGRIGERLQSTTLLPCSEGSVGAQGLPTEAGVWNKALSGRRRVRRL